MLELVLREEFRGKRLKDTQIQLRKSDNTGAIQQPAASFLEITYPSGDVLKSLRALSETQARPVVLMGHRGRGKSHLMAVLHHALCDGAAVQNWLSAWKQRLKNDSLAQIDFPQGLHVISQSLHEGTKKFLWDVVFANHPRGEFYKGKWTERKERSHFPPKDLLVEMFQETPTALLFDEYQLWYDGQPQSSSQPHQTWAFNFIQILSEIASEVPGCLRLVVSVRDGTTDAYQQIHRVNPLKVDFSGPSARQDRLRLLLHRLFLNRLQIPESEIDKLLKPHLDQYLRLYEISADRIEAERNNFREAWPFSPPLMSLLEDQVLVATDTQQTRDLMIILAGLFKGGGQDSAVITPANFNLMNEDDEVAAHIEAVASEQHRRLREVARRNQTAVQSASPNWKTDLPQMEGILASLWLRSLAVGNSGGAEPRALQLDVTRQHPLDENKFVAQLEQIEEFSFNIHRDGNRLVFRDEENARTRLLSEARNDKLFSDGSDFRELALQIRYCLGGEEANGESIVVPLERNWQTSPWTGLAESLRPETWGERLPIIVLPETPKDLGATLGPWLKAHVSAGRNRIRFLIPRADLPSLTADRDLLVKARAHLKATEWKSNPVYREFQKNYKAELQAILKERFDRFAILDRWNFQQPELSQFSPEKLNEQGSKIPQAIEKSVRENLFELESFKALVLELAGQNQTVAKLLSDLRDPRPNFQPCIPWLGEAQLKDRLVRICASGAISLNLRETETLQRKSSENSDEAWNRMKGRLGTGKDLETTRIQLPQALATSQAVQPALGGANLISQDTAPAYTPQPASPVPSSPFAATAVVVPEQVRLQAASTAPLNLVGRLESWGVGPATRVRKVRLEIDWESANGSQLADLIKKLPDGLRCSLELDSEA